MDIKQEEYQEDDMSNMVNEFYNDDVYDYREMVHKNHMMDNMDEDDENDFDLEDHGPLSINKKSGANAHNRNNPDMDEQYYNDYFQEDQHADEENDDMGAHDTFFKRVDSMEMVKPKKTKIISNYLIGELLGDGSYGKVKECLDVNTLARRAVKIINLRMVAKKIPRGIENVRKEISIMKTLDHPNVIRMYSTFEKGPQTEVNNRTTKNENDSNNNKEPSEVFNTVRMINSLEKSSKLYIFMDYCITSVERLIKNAPNKSLCNWQANFYFKQLIDGLEYLHSLNIIHNDIKPGNLLITCDDVLKICDFSISTKLNLFYEHEYLKNLNDNDEEMQNNINPNLLDNNTSKFPITQCTPMFQCPEMLDENMDELMILKNATKIDIWSSGISLFQITTGYLPFQGQTIHQIYENIRTKSQDLQIPEVLDTKLAQLLKGMLDPDPLKRWSIKQIRDCDWFKKKHSVVQEDLVTLPTDVINNEFSTFRMLNYLEKHCESKFDENNDFKSQQAIPNNNNISQVQNTNNNNQIGAKPKPATKVKRNHCSLM
jgi:serine/threonine-protein kinase 11